MLQVRKINKDESSEINFAGYSISSPTSATDDEYVSPLKLQHTNVGRVRDPLKPVNYSEIELTKGKNTAPGRIVSSRVVV